MSNTTMMAQARRSGGRLWRRVCLRAAGTLMIACAAMIVFPGLAKAQSSGCRANSSTVIDLIPSVNFMIENLPPPGTEIYRTKTYVINYECTLYDRFGQPDTGTPQLQALSDYSSLNNALNRAGLRLYIVVNGNESSPWVPNLDPAAGPSSEFFPLGASYTESTGPRVVTLIAKLKVINNSQARRVTPFPLRPYSRSPRRTGAALLPARSSSPLRRECNSRPSASAMSASTTWCSSRASSP